jgi:hypothetical protein
MTPHDLATKADLSALETRLAEQKTDDRPQHTNWMHDEPCPRCDGMTLATNGRSRWCIASGCNYAVQIKR